MDTADTNDTATKTGHKLAIGIAASIKTIVVIVALGALVTFSRATIAAVTHCLAIG